MTTNTARLIITQSIIPLQTRNAVATTLTPKKFPDALFQPPDPHRQTFLLLHGYQATHLCLAFRGINSVNCSLGLGLLGGVLDETKGKRKRGDSNAIEPAADWYGGPYPK
jgi:hypothetical protein